MGFHEVRFPEFLSWGSGGGPGFNTKIISVDSGAEERVARWDQARRRYDVAKQVQTDVELAELLTFYMARQGCAYGFRFKDWSDYATSARHVTHGSAGAATTPVDMNFAIGDGTTTLFQLTKTYSDTVVARVRKITKPVVGTATIAVNGVTQTTGFTVSYTNGQVAFDTAPANGTIISWGGEFDVPSRFGEEIDNGLPVTLDAYDAGSAKVPIVELLDEGTNNDEFFYGGAEEITATGPIVITGISRVWIVNFTDADGHNVVLPDPTDLSPGGPHFYIYNEGSTYYCYIADHTGTHILQLLPGKCAQVILTIDGVGTKVWVVH